MEGAYTPPRARDCGHIEGRQSRQVVLKTTVTYFALDVAKLGDNGHIEGPILPGWWLTSASTRL
jgi:hypothetical protein